MNILDVDIDSLLECDDEEIDERLASLTGTNISTRQDKNIIQDAIYNYLTELAGKLWSEDKYKKLQREFYFITRLRSLGATRSEVLSDLDVIWPCPDRKGKGKCYDRWHDEMNALLDIYETVTVMKDE